jgi:predicted nuclease of predicted toxin-antitoxin system
LRLKVDENISRTGIELLRRHIGDVATVHEQRLSGKSDELIYRMCIEEDRALVTLDRDFGQVTRFPPEETPGIVILELGNPATTQLLHSRLTEFLALAAVRPVAGELWIVEPGRVRVRSPAEE